MKRTPLQRRTPLSRTPKRRKQPPEVTLRTPTKRLGRGLDPKLRALVYRRSGGACDWCGRPMREAGFEAHHRKLRSQGGADDAYTLIGLHGICHGQVHAHPGLSRAHGFIVPGWADPAEVPIRRHGRRWQQPTPDGWVGADPIDQGDAVPAAPVERSGPNMPGPVSGYPGTAGDDLGGFESEAS